MNELIDTHAHLDQIEGLPAALQRARQAGVSAIIAVGVDLASSRSVLEITGKYREPRIYPALGMHPGDLKPAELPLLLDLIRKNISALPAVGEIGLDFWYKQARKPGPGRDLQEDVFFRQLDIAREYDKPVIIHSRGSWRECLEAVLQREIKKALFHWYSGPEDVLEDILKEGFFISAAPSAEYSREHRAAIKKAPLERILIETDSPVVYKPPSGKYASEPKDVARTLKAVAGIKNIEEAEAAQRTTANARKLFDLA
jgi:TatD DNase family protein